MPKTPKLAVPKAPTRSVRPVQPGFTPLTSPPPPANAPNTKASARAKAVHVALAAGQSPRKAPPKAVAGRGAELYAKTRAAGANRKKK